MPLEAWKAELYADMLTPVMKVHKVVRIAEKNAILSAELKQLIIKQLRLNKHLDGLLQNFKGLCSAWMSLENGHLYILAQLKIIDKGSITVIMTGIIINIDTQV